MPVLEFTIEGPPVSYQTRDRVRLREWQQRIREAAAARWQSSAPLTAMLKMTVTSFHERPAIRMDNDNMVKPIQDALIGLIYQDDRQINDTVVRKTAIDGTFYVRGASMVLLEAFSRGMEFLHVIIESSPDHALLLK